MRRETPYPQILNYFTTEWGEKWMKFVTIEMGRREKNGHLFGGVFANKNFTMDMLQKYPPTSTQDDFKYLSGNPNLTIDVVKKYSKQKWDTQWLCENPALQINDLLKLRKFFDWKYICRNPNFTFDHVLQHPRTKFDWMRLSEHKNVTMDTIEQNINKPWHFYWVSKNPNLNIEFIRKHLDELWMSCWHNISCNPAMTTDIIENNPDLPWNWAYVQHNPNLTIEFIEKHPDKDWTIFYANRCKYPCKKPTMQYLRERWEKIIKWTACCENFDEDRDAFISHRFSWLFLVSIYEHYCEMSVAKKRKRFGCEDMVFANDYLMSMIVKY